MTPGGRGPLLRELTEWAIACGWTVFARDGGRLGSEIGQAVAADAWDRLRQRVTRADLVVIEGVEAIGSRSRLAGFRHLFDAATANGCRFCVSLASHPAAAALPPDLAGRLSGGLVLPLAQETSPAPAGSRRDGLGASAAAVRRPPSLERVFAATARHYGIAVVTLVGPSRSRTVCQARSLAMYLARQLTERSYSAIGQACGSRDHTTALHGARITSTRIAGDPVIAADAAAIIQSLDLEPRPRRRRKTVSTDCR